MPIIRLTLSVGQCKLKLKSIIKVILDMVYQVTKIKAEKYFKDHSR